MRITPARQKIVEIFDSTKKPISAPQLKILLEKSDIRVNKTTIYREVGYLSKLGIINEVKLDSQIAYYESAHMTHHHHLVCKKCGEISDVSCEEFEEVMNAIAVKAAGSGFRVEKHDLEFYGKCSDCLK